MGRKKFKCNVIIYIGKNRMGRQWLIKFSVVPSMEG